MSCRNRNFNDIMGVCQLSLKACPLVQQWNIKGKHFHHQNHHTGIWSEITELSKMVVLQYCLILVLFSVLSLLSAYKTDTWPPKLVYEYFDVPGIVSKCKNQCNTTTEQIIEFETTTDVDHLPNADELKCYFLCLNIEAHIMKSNSTEIYISELIDFIQKFKEEDYKNLLTLSKGCLSRVKKLKEPTEVAYQLNVCGKQNSLELYYTFY